LWPFSSSPSHRVSKILPHGIDQLPASLSSSSPNLFSQQLQKTSNPSLSITVQKLKMHTKNFLNLPLLALDQSPNQAPHIKKYFKTNSLKRREKTGSSTCRTIT
jgi:hypothetical protein